MPAPADPGRGDIEAAEHRLLDALPRRLHPTIGWITHRYARRILIGTADGMIRVQIFDRAMILAAQAFTSVFPILILVGAGLGAKKIAQFMSLAKLPESSRNLIYQAVNEQGLSTFGVVGALVVLLSSTGFARALARAYGAIWGVSQPPSGPRAAWRSLLTVLIVATLLIGSRLAGLLTAPLPRPGVWSGLLLLLVDFVVAVVVPRLLLGQAVPVRMLLPSGCAFAIAMLGMRPAGEVYLPRALQSSYDRYGTIGLAFTYIGWLYALAFCLLLTAVVGHVVTREGLPGGLGRGSHAEGVMAAGAEPVTMPVAGNLSELERSMMTTSQEPAVPQFFTVLGHRYWLRLVIGVLAIGIGAIAFAWPSATVQVIGVLFGLNLLVTGLIRAGLLLFAPGYPVLYRVLGIIFGVLTAMVGILCLRNVTGSAVLLVVVVAIGWLLDGLVEIFLAAGNPGDSGNNWQFVSGLALILGGIAVLVWPELGLKAFVAIGATILVFVGLGQVIGAIAGLRAEHRAHT